MAWLIGAAIAAAIVVASAFSRGGDTAYGDGLIVRYVASHLTTPAEQIHPVIVERGPSLRYGRIGMPAAVWLFSAGHEGAMNTAQGIISILAGAAAAGAAFRLFPGFGPISGALPFIAPGFPLAISGGFTDAMAVALVLWGTVLALESRWGAAAVVISLALLTRENAAIILAGIGLLALLQRRWGAIGILALAPLPALGWYAVVASRYGYLPPLDPYLRTATDAVGPPLIALVRSFTEPASAGALVLVAIHVALGIALVVMAASGSRIAVIGAVAAVQLLVSGPFAWEFIGDGVRTSVLIQVFFLLAVTSRSIRERPLSTPPVQS